MRDYKAEFESRVEYVRAYLESSHCAGIVFGNSGGKDCALVGIICKAACENTIGVLMPCGSKRNYNADTDDAVLLAEQFNIESRTVDLSPARDAMTAELEKVTSLNNSAITNIAPRLRMTTLYAIAAAENLLVAGTGNRSERHMGYFTKWGDGGSDFNPISDLTATEVLEFLDYLGAPRRIIEKAPSAGLFDGQTDEAEMGVTYKAIDDYLLYGIVNERDKAIIDRYHSRSEHKRRPISTFENRND